MRTDKNIPLGVVKGRYKIVQNVEAFDFVDDIIGNKDIPCRYETAGSLFNGKRIFLLVKLPNKELLGDEVENYLFFTNSHDGTSSLMAGITNIRVVCNNTLQMAIQGSKRTWSCRHTTNITRKKQQAKESLGLAVKYMDSMNDMAEKLYQIKIDEEAFFRKLFDKSNMAEKNKEETIERIHLIYNEKDDLQNFKGTGWGMYNAIADFVSNTIPLRMTKTYNENKLVGFFDGNKLLQTSQELLMVA
jgi:phage/plasmid-like protein (TIGR03299 family)